MMATAIFTEDFHYDRRPRQAIAFVITASDTPQSLPRDLIDAAIAAGKATEIKAIESATADPTVQPVPADVNTLRGKRA